MLRAFFSANCRISNLLEQRLAHAKVDAHAWFVDWATQCMNERPHLLVVDIGGGRKCDFARYRNGRTAPHIIATDLSAKELSYNSDADETLVSNAAHLPFADSAVDVVTCCRLLEHVADPTPVLRECHRILRSGGHLILFLPSRYAPFALIKRLLPEWLVRRVISYVFAPDSRHFCWSPLYYRNCYPSALRRLLQQTGFSVQKLHVSYYQSSHFKSFVPLYVLSAGYEWLIFRLRLENLCSYVAIFATATT